MENNDFHTYKNNYFVCELPDVKCQRTGRCVRRPASGVRPETKRTPATSHNGPVHDKTGTATLGRVCRDLGLGDARGRTRGRQI